MTIEVEHIIKALRQHKNVLLYGPPGSGKSHLMKTVASRFEAEATPSTTNLVTIDTDEERTPFSTQRAARISTRWVTFHQGYSYEDFIVGMRPVAEAVTQGGFSIQPRPGVLLELVAQARQGGSGLLLIDEINRGNTSRIFGEFITLMEDDKRLDDQGYPTATTVTITLPYLSPGETVEVTTDTGTEYINRDFAMPANIYTLASMNSVDKSIAPLDTALRRRFHIINLHPTKQATLAAVGLPEDASLSPTPENKGPSARDIAIIGAALLCKINRGIGLYLGNDFMLGQWYLACFNDMGDELARASLAQCWLYRIIPQLIELFHGRDEQLISLLGQARVTEDGSCLTLIEPSEEESELGATSYVEVASPIPSETKIIEFLQRLVSE